MGHDLFRKPISTPDQVQGKLFPDRALSRAYRRRVDQRRDEPLAIEWFDQEAVHASGEAGLAILRGGIRGERDNRRMQARAFGF